ncbi:unnamed protein product, partial [Meganyctiphanes norvegica]
STSPHTMNCLILCPLLFTIALGAPQGYSLPAPSNPFRPINGGPGSRGGRFDNVIGGGFIGGAGGAFGGAGGAFGGAGSAFGGVNNGGFVVEDNGNSNGGVINDIRGTLSNEPCPEEQVRHVDGKCHTPEITRNVFVYAAPENAVDLGPAPELPSPRVEYNIVFVRTPEFIEGADPIVVPPPQKKTLVYVLSKKQILGGQQIIEVPSGSVQNPEVFYVNYRDGENPELPGGINLQDALSAAADAPTIIGGDFTEVVGVDRESNSDGGITVTDIGNVNGGVSGIIGGGFRNPILSRPSSRPSNLYSSPQRV